MTRTSIWFLFAIAADIVPRGYMSRDNRIPIGMPGRVAFPGDPDYVLQPGDVGYVWSPGAKLIRVTNTPKQSVRQKKVRSRTPNKGLSRNHPDSEPRLGKISSANLQAHYVCRPA